VRHCLTPLYHDHASGNLFLLAKQELREKPPKIELEWGSNVSL
jgi:hypothetical protein